MTRDAKPSVLKNPLTVVVVAVTILVVAVTIFMATRKERPLPTVAVEANTAVPLEEQVLEKVTQIMNAANSLPPTAANALGVYEQARNTMLAYVKANPQDTRIRPLLAEVYMKLGRNAEAMAMVDDVLARKADSAQALWIKGQIMHAGGDANYLDFFRQAADSPNSTPKLQSAYGLALIQNRELDAAGEYLRKAVSAGANDAATFGGLAEVSLARKNLAEAEGYLNRAVRDPRAGTRLWAMLGGVQRDMGKLDNAAASVQQAITLVPKGGVGAISDEGQQADLYMLLGQIRMQQQRQGDAAEAFVAAQQFAPLQFDASLQAAKAYYLAGRFGQAMKNIDIAFKISPGDREVTEWKKRIEDARFGPPKS